MPTGVVFPLFPLSDPFLHQNLPQRKTNLSYNAKFYYYKKTQQYAAIFPLPVHAHAYHQGFVQSVTTVSGFTGSTPSKACISLQMHRAQCIRKKRMLLILAGMKMLWKHP